MTETLAHASEQGHDPLNERLSIQTTDTGKSEIVGCCRRVHVDDVLVNRTRGQKEEIRL